MKRIIVLFMVACLCVGAVFAANEMSIPYDTGQTLYAVRVNSAGQVAVTATGVFENWGASGHAAADYNVPMSEVGTGGGSYVGNWGTADAGRYTYVVFKQAGATPANTDEKIGQGEVVWSGTAEQYGATDANATEITANQATLLASISSHDVNMRTVAALNDANRITSDALLATKAGLSATDANVIAELSAHDANMLAAVSAHDSNVATLVGDVNTNILASGTATRTLITDVNTNLELEIADANYYVNTLMASLFADVNYTIVINAQDANLPINVNVVTVKGRDAGPLLLKK